MEQKKRVAIVGGGAAGLGAAATLLANNKDIEVHLLEARNQFGGRAITDTSINGFPFDLGPLYIQDSNVNPWKNIAKMLEMPLVEEDTFGYLQIFNGKEWILTGTGNDEDDLDEIKEDETDNEKETRKYQRFRKLINSSFEEAKKSKNKAVSKKLEREDGLNLQHQLLAEALHDAGAIVESGEIWQVNAAEHQRVEEIESTDDEGPNLFVKSGLGNLINAFAKHLIEKYDKRFLTSLKTVVKSITYGKTVTLSYGDSEKLEVDACIVTVPTKVISQGKIKFEPKLPNKFIEAFSLLPLGSYKKLAFEIKGNLELIKPDTYYYLAEPKYEGVWQYFRLGHRDDVLVVHTAGDFALRLDGMPDETVYELFLTALDNAYPNADILSYFKNGKRAISNWTNDPYTLGAYSYTAVSDSKSDDETALKARLVISEPIDNVLYFAGEANNIAKYATIAGAYQEGERAADKVLKYLFK